MKIVLSGNKKEKIRLKPFVKLQIIIEKEANINLELIQDNDGVYEENVSVLLKKDAGLNVVYLHRKGQVVSKKKFNLEKNTNLNYEEKNYGFQTKSESFFELGENSRLEVISKHKGHEQVYDAVLNVIHKEKSFASLKSINLLNNSKAKTRGRITVLKNAAGTETSYVSKNVVLGDCDIDVIPELDIRNEAVICKHSASIETVGAEQLYYLMSRGLNKSQAINIVSKGLLESGV